MGEVHNLGDVLVANLQQERLEHELRLERIDNDLDRATRLYAGQLALNLLEDDINAGER